MTGHQPHEIAQRPRRAHGLRLVPLGLLVVCVLAAAVIGSIVDYKPAPVPEVVAAAPTKPPKKPSLPKACTLPVKQGLRNREPWLDAALRPKSEKQWTRHIAREEPAYVQGEDGWLFWNDWQVNDMSQSVGRITLDDAAVSGWASYLKSMQRSAERAGSQFYVMVAPAKWDVYPQKMPSWARDLRGRVSLDILMKAHPEIPFIDTRSPLRTAARKNATYEPLDSHWTPYGGYVAWKSATRCLRATTPNNKPLGVPEITGVGLVPSNNEFAPQGIVPDPQPQRTVPVYARALPTMTAQSLDSGAAVEIGADNVVDTTLLPLMTRTQGAQSDDRLLVLRDSTGGSLSPLWAASFASTVQVSHGLGGTAALPKIAQLAKKYHPDITMIVLTERYLGYEPPA
jgi:acetyltransferase AlgX (SGNH hydrolase-like protein)